MNAAYRTLIEAATLAPSGDNTQAWQFTVDESSQTIKVSVDPTRDESPMNAGQRMSRIAVGAAVENMLVAAAHNRWSAKVEHPADANSLIVGLAGVEAKSSGEVPGVVTRRVSNRKLYDGSKVTASEMAAVEQALSASPGVRAIWLIDPAKLQMLAELIGQADAMMFGISAVRKAFLANIRFDRPALENVEEGLSLGSLEVSAAERFALRMLGKVPARLFSAMCLERSFRAKAAKLVRSASGLCLLVTPRDDPGVDGEVGRLMCRAWLTLTSGNFAVQPMMSLPVLDNLRVNQVNALQDSALVAINSLNARVQAAAGNENSGRVAAILRFGRAGSPTGRTGRRSPTHCTAPVYGGDSSQAVASLRPAVFST